MWVGILTGLGRFDVTQVRRQVICALVGTTTWRQIPKRRLVGKQGLLPLKLPLNRSCGGRDGNAVAELLQTAHTSLGDALAVVVVPMRGAQIDEMGPVSKHVVDGDKHGMRNRHLGALGAPSAGQPAVAGAEEVGSRPTGSDGTERRFDQGGTKPRVAGPGRRIATTTGAFVGARTDPRPRREMAGGGEPAHIDPNLSDDLLGPVACDAGDLVHQVDRCLKGRMRASTSTSMASSCDSITSINSICCPSRNCW